MFQNDEKLTFERMPEAVSTRLKEMREVKGLILNVKLPSLKRIFGLTSSSFAPIIRTGLRRRLYMTG